MKPLFILAVRALGGEDPFVQRQDLIGVADDWWIDNAVKHGLLAPASPCRYYVCLGCPDQPSLEVVAVDAADGSRRHYVSCPDCGLCEVKARELDRWTINKNMMMTIVGAALDGFDYKLVR